MKLCTNSVPNSSTILLYNLKPVAIDGPSCPPTLNVLGNAPLSLQCSYAIIAIFKLSSTGVPLLVMASATLNTWL